MKNQQIKNIAFGGHHLVNSYLEDHQLAESGWKRNGGPEFVPGDVAFFFFFPLFNGLWLLWLIVNHPWKIIIHIKMPAIFSDTSIHIWRIVFWWVIYNSPQWNFCGRLAPTKIPPSGAFLQGMDGNGWEWDDYRWFFDGSATQKFPNRETHKSKMTKLL